MRYLAGKISNKKKEYEDLGRDYGSRQYPSIDSIDDKNEIQLKHLVETEVNLLDDAHSDDILKISNSLIKINNDWMTEKKKNASLLDIDKTIERLNAELDIQFIKSKEELSTKLNVYYKALGLMNKFKQLNKIDRDAKYHESKIFAISIIIAIIFIEAMFNSFAHKGDGGIIDGAFVAAGISIFNVAIAFFLGRGFCYKNHKDTFKIVFGWICAILALTSAIYFNSLFASYRFDFDNRLNLGDVDVQEASKEAFKYAYSNAWKIFVLDIPFKELISWLTFWVTMAFSTIAFFDGYFWDDPIPKYGDLDRDVKAKKEDYESSWQIVTMQADLALAQYVLEYEKELLCIEFYNPNNIAREKTKLEVCKGELVSDFEKINLEHDLVIQSYRHFNKATRGDGAFPSFFELKPIKISSRCIDKYDQLIKEFQSFLDKESNEYFDLFNKLRFNKEDFKNKSQSLSDALVSKFRTKIEREASLRSTSEE